MPVFENWARNVRTHPDVFARPADEAALQAIVREAGARGSHVRVAGAGHSFTPVAASESVQLNLDGISGVVNIDREAKRARIRGGTRIRDIGPAAAGDGLALHNMGDFDAQSIAGALGTGTHGTGRTLGAMPTQLRGLTLLTASGDVLRIDPDADRDLFKAAQVSLGMLGITTEVELDMAPSYRLREERKTMDLEDCLSRIDTLTADNRNFEFFWFPYSDLCGTKALNATDEPAVHSPVRDFLVDTLLENAGFHLLSEACRWLPRRCGAITRFMANAMSEGTRVDESYRIYASPRWVRFREMEYAVPAASGPDCLRELRAYVREQQVAVGFPIEYRYVAADDIWLSPFHSRESAVIAVHMYRPMEHAAYFDSCEAIFRNHGGRPHWGKMHSLGPAALREMYPHWDDFLRVRQELDPGGLFLSPYLRSLFGVS